jgi:transposase InsO family protein
VTDISYVWTWEGWLYLAVILDLFSRRAVGWSMADHLRTELVLEALNMALGLRLPQGDLLHHSDRGSQYASSDYRDALQTQGITCSMSRKGDCWDNAVMESFFGTLKTELIHRRSWPTRREARSAIHEYIAMFYNKQRCHSYLDYLSPVEFEKLAEQKDILAA